MKVIIVWSKDLLWEPVIRTRRGEIEMNFWGTLPPVKDRGAKTGDCGGWELGERPLLRQRALLIGLDFQGRRRWGTPKSSVEERDFLDLAPVDERGQHREPARGRLGNKEQREGGGHAD